MLLNEIIELNLSHVKGSEHYLNGNKFSGEVSIIYCPKKTYSILFIALKHLQMNQ